MEYHLDEWFVITPYVAGLLHPAMFFIFDHNYSVKGGLKEIDRLVQSAEYWCPYGTFMMMHFRLKGEVQ